MDRGTIRESGTGESSRPKPVGDYDGVNRRRIYEALLKEEVARRTQVVTGRIMNFPMKPYHERVQGIVKDIRTPWQNIDTRGVERRIYKAYVPLRFRIRMWLQRALGLAAAGVISVHASAPPLTPAQAADVLRPNQTFICADCDGPRSIIVGGGERYEDDFDRAHRSAAEFNRDWMLRQLNDYRQWPVVTGWGASRFLQRPARNPVAAPGRAMHPDELRRRNTPAR